MPRGVKVLNDPRDSEIRYLKGVVDLYEIRMADLERILSETVGYETTGTRLRYKGEEHMEEGVSKEQKGPEKPAKTEKKAPSKRNGRLNAHARPEAPTQKRRGRPKGSKNKPKVAAGIETID